MTRDRDLPHITAPRLPERPRPTLLDHLTVAAIALGALAVARLFVQAIGAIA